MSTVWEYAWFKRANGHQVTAPTATHIPLGLMGLGAHPNRYVLRRRRVEAGAWEDA